MGSCVSARSGSDDNGTLDMLDTAKVVTVEGALREYSVPTKVAEILDENKASSTASFLCSSDELDLEKHIPAMNSDSWVEIGQMYFILPRSMLGRPLKGQEMAALAVNASSALVGTLMERKRAGGTREKRGMQIVPVLCDADDESFDDRARTIGSGFGKPELSRKAMLRNPGTKVMGRRASAKGRGRNRSRLAAIQE